MYTAAPKPATPPADTTLTPGETYPANVIPVGSIVELTDLHGYDDSRVLMTVTASRPDRSTPAGWELVGPITILTETAPNCEVTERSGGELFYGGVKPGCLDADARPREVLYVGPAEATITVEWTEYTRVDKTVTLTLAAYAKLLSVSPAVALLDTVEFGDIADIELPDSLANITADAVETFDDFRREDIQVRQNPTA